MRILHLTPRYTPARGGAEQHISVISRRLVDAQHEVTVITSNADRFEHFWDPRQPRVDQASEILSGVRVLRFPVRHPPWQAPLVYRALRRFLWLLSRIRPVPPGVGLRLCRLTPYTPALWQWLESTQERFDVVAGMNIAYEQFMAAGLHHARRNHIPFIAYPLTHLGDGPAPAETEESHFYTMRHQRALLHAADALVTNTETELAYYRAGGYRGRGRAVPPGIDPQATLPDPPAARRRLAARYDDPELLDAPLIFSLSTLCYNKGTLHLVEAVRQLWAGGYRVRLLLAGTPLDDFAAYWKKLPAGVRAKIHFRGPISEEEKQDALAAATCFAMPSRADSFGIVFLEAWEHAKPVIGARAWGITEDVIHHERDGLLVPFGDVTAISAAIRRLLDEPELAAALGRQGQRAVHERYTWEHALQALLPLYEELGQA